MRVLSALTAAPWQVRRSLRQRFHRELLREEANPPVRPPAPFDDDAVLTVLSGLRVSAPTLDDVKQAYDDARADDPSAPDFETVVGEGWVKGVWGRVVSPRRFQRELDLPGHAFDTLTRAHSRRYEFDGEIADLRLAALIKQLVRDPERTVALIPTQTPSWVAGRLWERASNVPTAHARLRQWVDQWELLGSPMFRASEVWTANEAKAFREASLAVLTEHAEPSWERSREELLAQLTRARGGSPASWLETLPPVPASNVGRMAWLNVNRGLDHWAHALGACGDLWIPLRLLLEDLEGDDFRADDPLRAKLFDVIVSRPTYLALTLRYLDSLPRVLADLVLHPPTTGVGCAIVASWPPRSNPWDDPLAEADGRDARARAVSDGVDILGAHLSIGTTAPREAAELLNLLQDPPLEPRSVAADRDVPLKLLRESLARQSRSVLTDIVSNLMSADANIGVSTNRFSAALDVVTQGGLQSVVPAKPFVDGYVDSIRMDGSGLTVARVGADQAASLVMLAERSGAPQLTRFLNPVNPKPIDEDEDNQYRAHSRVTASHRAHVRILARAIVGLRARSRPSAAVIAALREAIARAASHKIDRAGSAFSAAAERLDRDRSMALDLGDALRVAGEEAPRLLEAILTIDEPLLLAQLAEAVPSTLRGRVISRLEELTPENAGHVSSLPDVHARIDALLTIGLVTVAERFVEDELKLTTLGTIRDRWADSLEFRLRVLLLRKDWDTLSTIALPDGLDEHQQRRGYDLLAFFRACAELDRPHGDLAKAEELFGDLHRRHQTVTSYAVNWFATRALQLLKDPFAVLDAEGAAKARAILDEAEAEIDTEELNQIGIAAHRLTCARLLLAVGEPRAAYDALAEVPVVSAVEPERTAVIAVALERSGRHTEAVEALSKVTISAFESDIDRAARALIASTEGGTRSVIPTTEERNRRLRGAYLEIRSLDPLTQAAVLHRTLPTLPAFVGEHVRATGAALRSLAPVLAERVTYENELMLVFRELLGSRLSFLDWALADQSEGGHSGGGNVGERDIVIKQQTSEVAVVEAMVCRTAITGKKLQNDIRSHFQKLFGYSLCATRALVLLDYTGQISELLKFLQHVLESDAPVDWKLAAFDRVEPAGSLPTALVATYAGVAGDAHVFVMVVDMAQQAERGAAGLARKTKRS